MKSESTQEGPDNKSPEGNSGVYQVLSGLFWLFSGTGVQAILRTIVLVVLARLLTPEMFGVIGAASVALGFAGFFFEFGIASALERRPELDERHLRTAFTVFSIFGLLVGGAYVLIAPLISEFFSMPELVPVLRIFALVFPIQGFVLVPLALMKRELRFRRLTTINVVSYTVGSGVVGIGMALMGFGVWTLVGAGLVQSLVGALLLIVSQPFPKRPMIDRETLQELAFVGGGFTLGRLLNYLAAQGDNIVVGRWLGADALGLYSRAYQLFIFPVTLFATSLKSVLLPSMAKVQHEPERLGFAYKQGSAVLALACLPTGIVAIVLAPELIHVLLGPQWTEVVLPFQILAAGIFFRAAVYICDALTQATGAVYRRAWRIGVYAFFVFAGALIGVRWGLAGVASGTLVALVVNYILLTQLSLAVISKPWRWLLASHLPAPLLATTTFLCVWPVAEVLRNLELPDIAVLLIAGVATGIIQLILLFLLPQFLLGPEGRYIVKTLAGFAAVKLNRLRWITQKKPAQPFTVD
jgi:O-antigen/teichoic acid export membrane protein